MIKVGTIFQNMMNFLWSINILGISNFLNLVIMLCYTTVYCILYTVHMYTGLVLNLFMYSTSIEMLSQVRQTGYKSESCLTMKFNFVNLTLLTCSIFITQLSILGGWD